MSLKKLSIYQRIVIVMLLIGLVPIFTTVVFVKSRTTKMITEQAIVSMKALQSAKTIDIQNNINGLIDKVKASADLQVILRAEEKLVAYHKKMKANPTGPYPINTT